MTISAQQIAMIFPKAGNETGGLVNVRRERMNYSAERAAQVFRKARGDDGGPSETCKEKAAAGEEAFASWIYAGIIGNGDEASGDGWKFRGGGIIQLTGRDNYKACGDALGVDLVGDPDSLSASPERSAAAAAWFMAQRAKIMPLLDSDSEQDFLAAARRVGLPPDDKATQNRLTFRKKAHEVLSAG